jgi:PhnB protein
MAVKPIPEGFHTVTPYLTVQGVAKLIDFLKQAFEARELSPHQSRLAAGS